MKKIIGAALAASLLASAAFAEVSFSYTGKGIFSDTTKKVNKVERNDCFGLELSNDVAGVVVDWDIPGGSSFELDAFYGWMTFGLPVGNLQITSGKWTARYSDRVKADAGDLDGTYFEAYKMGNIIDGTVSADSDNLTGNAMSTVLAYSLTDALPGALMVKAGAVSTADNDAKATATYYGRPEDETKLFCAFVGEVCYRQEGAINLDLAVRHSDYNVTSLGFFVSPLMVENLKATLGFSYGYNTADVTELAFDLRARYALSDKVALNGMINYSQVSIEDVDDPVKAMWTMLSLNYVAGDNIRFLATLQNTIKNFDAKYGACVTAFTPACEIKASEKATVTTAVDVRWDNSAATGIKPFAGTAGISIPLYVTLSL